MCSICSGMAFLGKACVSLSVVQLTSSPLGNVLGYCYIHTLPCYLLPSPFFFLYTLHFGRFLSYCGFPYLLSALLPSGRSIPFPERDCDQVLSDMRTSSSLSVDSGYLRYWRFLGLKLKTEGLETGRLPGTGCSEPTPTRPRVPLTLADPPWLRFWVRGITIKSVTYTHDRLP